jgi:ribosomal protein L11 methyltransferase
MTTEISSTYAVLLLSTRPSLSETLSSAFWEIEECRGIEEIPDPEGDGIYVPSEEFEVLEFGSEAARRCAEWLESGTFQSQHKEVFLKVYFEFQKGHFPLSADRFLQDAISAYKGRFEILSWNELPDTNYLEEYKKRVKGVRVGRSLWVGPPWDSSPPGRKSLFVEPGMAFGTGDHPTTQMCLEFLEDLAADSKFQPRRIVDIGTGSGILALAARYFFPKAELIVTDLDPLCAQEVAKTFVLNQTSMDKMLQVFGPKADLLRNPMRSVGADLLLSNIYAEVLIQLLPQMALLVKTGAPWIVSGLLEGPATESFESASSAYFQLQSSRSRIQEHPRLEASSGLSKISQAWGARLFIRK